MNRLHIAAAVLMWTLAGPAGAAEYHVANQHPAADDANPGTAERPFKHIQAAADKAQPGDTITVRGGTYREMIVWKTPGLEGKMITLRAAPGETAVVKGSVAVKGWEKTTAKECGLAGEYPQENLWVKRDWVKKNIYPADEPNMNTPMGNRLLESPRWAFWKDAPLHGAGWLTFAFTRDELQEGRIHHDEQARTLTVWLPPDIAPNENGVEVCVRSLLLTAATRDALSYVTVRGMQWRHGNTRNLTNWPAMSIQGHSVFEDNIVSWCDYGGLSFSGEKCIIRRNTIAFCGAGAFGGRGDEHLIEDNRVLYNNLDRHDTFNDSGGGKSVFLRRCVFRRHEAAYNIGPGIWLDISNNDNLFESCYFHHNHGAGMFLEISHRNIVRNCIFAYNSEMPGGMRIKWEPHGNAPTKARTRYYTERGDLGWGAYNSSCAGTQWLNNLFYANQNAGLVCEGGWRSDGSVKDLQGKEPAGSEEGWTTTKNVTIMNNIFAGNGGPQLMIRSPRNDKACVNNVSDYNLFDLPVWTQARIASEGWGGPQYTDLAAWQKATGWDMHSLTGNAELILPAGGDFMHTLISPAADRGIALENVKTDYRGVARPVGKAYDIGPFERYSLLEARPAAGVPAGLTFKTVDIKALLNRALADEKADDGAGGWSDQGPSCDLREFAKALPTDAEGRPTAGTARLGDVNFRVEYPASILVLDPGKIRPGNLPEKTTIPVGDKAEYVFFLHAAAWNGSWQYVARYEDGSALTIVMNCPVNMRDWAAGTPNAEFRFEKDTSTKAAWVGKTGSFPTVAVYRTAWKNPKPEAKIREIEMIGYKGVPGLVAVTLGSR